jgi:hypothetical protein
MNFSKTSDLKYREAVKKHTKGVEALSQLTTDSSLIYWLSKEIYAGKNKLRYNSVDFIVGKFLTRNETLVDFNKISKITIYVIGTFNNEFHPISKVAQALADFYLEMEVMPNLIPITKADFLAELNSSVKKINNGVVIYDRERNLY